jgi:hypothetical protein
MGNDRRRRLRIAAVAVALICLAFHVLAVGVLGLDSDSAVACGRQLSWWEWIECSHETRGQIVAAEFVVVIWTIAGVGSVLGRFLTPYISILVPIGTAIAVTLGLTRYWLQETVTLGRDSIYVVSAGTLIAGSLVVGPVAAAWLWGLCNRSHRQTVVRLATAFD